MNRPYCFVKHSWILCFHRIGVSANTLPRIPYDAPCRVCRPFCFTNCRWIVWIHRIGVSAFVFTRFPWYAPCIMCRPYCFVNFRYVLWIFRIGVSTHFATRLPYYATCCVHSMGPLTRTPSLCKPLNCGVTVVGHHSCTTLGMGYYIRFSVVLAAWHGCLIRISCC